MPLAIPVTIPVTGSTVAIVVPVLLHVPPLGVLLSVVVYAGHTTESPVISVSGALTDITALPVSATLQPVVVTTPKIL